MHPPRRDSLSPTQSQEDKTENANRIWVHGAEHRNSFIVGSDNLNSWWGEFSQNVHFCAILIYKDSLPPWLDTFAVDSTRLAIFEESPLQHNWGGLYLFWLKEWNFALLFFSRFVWIKFSFPEHELLLEKAWIVHYEIILMFWFYFENVIHVYYIYITPVLLWSSNYSCATPSPSPIHTFFFHYFTII